MKNAFPFILFLSVSFASIGQTTQTKYYRSMPFEEEVPLEKAKYAETITEGNGVITTTVRNLKRDRVEHSETWKGDEPFGVWVGLTGRGPEERDFNFEVSYRQKDCVNPESLRDIGDFSQSNKALAYTAPVIEGGYSDILSFLVSNLRYPSKARRNGTQGTVELAFTVTEDGYIHDIVVTKAVHLLLDKEAVRVIRKIKLSSPPLLNGKPQEICVKMPLRFKLA